MTEKDVNLEKMLLGFFLNSDLYAIDLSCVREISEVLPIQSIPHTVDFCSGLSNLRGDFVVVLDLRQRFGYSKVSQKMNAMIVVEHGHHLLGLVIDKLEKTHIIQNLDQVIHPLEIPSAVDKEYVLGVLTLSGKTAQFLDVEKIIAKEHLTKLPKHQASFEKSGFHEF